MQYNSWQGIKPVLQGAWLSCDPSSHWSRKQEADNIDLLLCYIDLLQALMQISLITIIDYTKLITKKYHSNSDLYTCTNSVLNIILRIEFWNTSCSGKFFKLFYPFWGFNSFLGISWEWTKTVWFSPLGYLGGNTIVTNEGNLSHLL